MPSGIQFRPSQGLVFVVSVALLGIACSHPVTVPNDGVDADRHQAPFQAEPAKSGNAMPQGSASAETGVTDAENRPPFREEENLPAGTLISVRLNRPISLAVSEANNEFEAVVSDPVTAQGVTLIPRGATVTGHVESARTSRVKPSRGYVRLVLASVQVGGREVSVQTASLFARPSLANEPSSSNLTLEKGRRLTFSLSEPVYIASPPPQNPR